MKRKNVVLMFLLTILFIGCGKVEKEISYATMIPSPEEIFEFGEITITDPDGGDAYILNVVGFTEDQYISYIMECKDSVFSNIVYDTGMDFGAYSEDGRYWLQVNLDDQNNIVYIICQKSKNYEED